MSSGTPRVWLCLFLALAAAPICAQGVAGPKVIYGTDDRIDVYQETRSERLAWVAATCGLVSASDLTLNGDGTYTLLTNDFIVLGRVPCEGEPFADQPTAPFCSGFLAAEDVVATAGHCMDTGRLSSTRYVFGFQMTDATTPVITLQADQVYSGIEIIERRYESSYDYTVVRLDRPVTAPGASPLPIRRSGVIPLGAQVGVIGHPTGLPLKLSFGDDTVVYNNTPAPYFVANLDTYGGNSGSPVFNVSTGLVEGVLVRGARDYNAVGSCFESNRLTDEEADEDVSKSTTFADAIPVEPHTADTDSDGSIGLGEVLRVIQFYNAGSLHCEALGEDGFAPGPGDQACANHESDYMEANFVISQSELLRLIQIYNVGAYIRCDSGEDGFCI
jgi:V8-like Glu-specific endopeptidase